MKKLLALLLLFGIVGCATNTPLILESRISGESYNSWDYYTYDDDFSNPGQTVTIEGAGYYPQAGIHFLSGLTFTF